MFPQINTFNRRLWNLRNESSNLEYFCISLLRELILLSSLSRYLIDRPIDIAIIKHRSWVSFETDCTLRKKFGTSPDFRLKKSTFAPYLVKGGLTVTIPTHFHFRETKFFSASNLFMNNHFH